MNKTSSQQHCTEGIALRGFADKLRFIVRNKQVLISNLFTSGVLHESSTRSIQLHLLKSDPNGRPQVGMLVRKMCCLIVDYCIPRKKIIEAIKYAKETGSSSRFIALEKEARAMFTSLETSGEGGELLLFMMTESILNYPQVISKMSIKTSPMMHFHGLDGVYISCLGKDSRLRLHFGESKLHNDLSKAVREAVKSIADMLKDEGFLRDSRRDYYLIDTQMDLGSIELEDSLKGFLDPEDERYHAPEVCAVLLAGHDLSDYPVVVDGAHIPKQILEQYASMIDVLERATAKHGITDFKIDLFVVPFPDVQTFRTEMLTELGIQCQH